MKALRVIGWYGRRNSGDEAFRDVHRLIMPNEALTWLHPGMEPPFCPELDVREDLVLMSAGDIVSPFYFNFVPPNARIIVYGAGIAWDEQINFLSGFKDRLVAVWVRNKTDVAPLRERGIETFYTPDIVFNLSPVVDNIKLKVGARKQAYILLTDSPRSDALRTNDLRRFTRIQAFFYDFAMCINFLTEYYDVTFIPFSFDINDFDLAAIYDLMPRLHERGKGCVKVLERELTPMEMINYFGSADLIVTMKFHGVVYSIMKEIPFLAISDTRKVQKICEDNGFGELWQPMIGMQVSVFKQAVKIAESERNQHDIRRVRGSLVKAADEETKRFQNLVTELRL